MVIQYNKLLEISTRVLVFSILTIKTPNRKTQPFLSHNRRNIAFFLRNIIQNIPCVTSQTENKQWEDEY